MSKWILTNQDLVKLAMNTNTDSPTPTQRIDFQAMGTSFFCILVGANEEICDAIYALANELESKWSRFVPDSEVMVLNNNPDSMHLVSDATLRLVSEMKLGFELTQGLYSANILSDLIDLGFATSRANPENVTLWSANSKTSADLSDVVIDLDTKSVSVPKGVALDAGGIGKGLAADLMSDYAMQLGAMGVAVFAGGDVAVKGMAQDAAGWKVNISDPNEVENFIDTISLSRGGLATSSPMGWKIGSSHHIIDPRTHRSSDSDVLQATVIAQNASQAEVLSKMCVILGAQEGISQIDSLGAAALIVDDTNQVHTSENWKIYS
ncbi:MAG: FAD:protein FMN transferase [Actinobacteria bacterium]|nr:FAD:protein FMN transferase [Actinomycetota bacterium]